MPRRVSFPMYAAPPEAADAFWRGLKRHLAEAGLPDVEADLAMPDDLPAHLGSPDLLLSQTCGYPLTHALAGKVKLVGTPSYAAFGCRGPAYASLFVVRRDDPAMRLADLRGRRAAFNSRDSQSGYNALRAAVAPLAEGGRFFGEAIETGAHLASMQLVTAGGADLAAVDCVTFALAPAEPGSAKEALRVVGVSDPAPGLPFVTGRLTSGDDLQRLRRALAAACRDEALAGCREALLLSGFTVLPLSAYDAIPAMAERACRLGYPELR